MRFLQFFTLLPISILWYLGERKMGVMRYNYFLKNEISSNILTDKIIFLIGIISIFSFLFGVYKFISTIRDFSKLKSNKNLIIFDYLIILILSFGIFIFSFLGLKKEWMLYEVSILTGILLLLIEWVVVLKIK